jgi:hypothetical protein
MSDLPEPSPPPRRFSKATEFLLWLCLAPAGVVFLWFVVWICHLQLPEVVGQAVLFLLPIYCAGRCAGVARASKPWLPILIFISVLFFYATVVFAGCAFAILNHP